MIDNRYNYCCLCSNKELDNNNEVTCKLTHKKPDFKEYCTNYLFSQEGKDRLIKARKEHYKLKNYDDKTVFQKIASSYWLIETNRKSDKLNFIGKDVQNDFYKKNRKETYWDMSLFTACWVIIFMLNLKFQFVEFLLLSIIAIFTEVLVWGINVVLERTKVLTINNQGVFHKTENYDWQSILFIHFEEKKILRNVTFVYLVINRVQLYEQVKIFLGVNYITSEIEKAVVFYSNNAIDAN